MNVALGGVEYKRGIYYVHGFQWIWKKQNKWKRDIRLVIVHLDVTAKETACIMQT